MSGIILTYHTIKYWCHDIAAIIQRHRIVGSGIKLRSMSVYWKKSFLSTESDTKILQSIYFAYKLGIISFYSNRMIDRGQCLRDPGGEHHSICLKSLIMHCSKGAPQKCKSDLCSNIDHDRCTWLPAFFS